MSAQPPLRSRFEGANTKLAKGAAKKAAADKNQSQSHGNKSFAEQALGGDILFSRGLGILGGQKQEGPPVSSVWGDIGAGIGNPFKGGCGPLPVPCWMIGVGVGGILLMLLIQ